MILYRASRDKDNKKNGNLKNKLKKTAIIVTRQPYFCENTFFCLPDFRFSKQLAIYSRRDTKKPYIDCTRSHHDDYDIKFTTNFANHSRAFTFAEGLITLPHHHYSYTKNLQILSPCISLHNSRQTTCLNY